MSNVPDPGQVRFQMDILETEVPRLSNNFELRDNLLGQGGLIINFGYMSQKQAEAAGPPDETGTLKVEHVKHVSSVFLPYSVFVHLVDQMKPIAERIRGSLR
ncbi:MAG: hypothetical protein HY319_23980 [Armatimonadetes bacterium]|nr:hypothetical protein [Armatimonadota bacterium]